MRTRAWRGCIRRRMRGVCGGRRRRRWLRKLRKLGRGRPWLGKRRRRRRSHRRHRHRCNYNLIRVTHSQKGSQSASFARSLRCFNVVHSFLGEGDKGLKSLLSRRKVFAGNCATTLRLCASATCHNAREVASRIWRLMEATQDVPQSQHYSRNEAHGTWRVNTDI